MAWPSLRIWQSLSDLKLPESSVEYQKPTIKISDLSGMPSLSGENILPPPSDSIPVLYQSLILELSTESSPASFIAHCDYLQAILYIILILPDGINYLISPKVGAYFNYLLLPYSQFLPQK
jgi:hypothetical protein